MFILNVSFISVPNWAVLGEYMGHTQDRLSTRELGIAALLNTRMNYHNDLKYVYLFNPEHTYSLQFPDLVFQFLLY